MKNIARMLFIAVLLYSCSGRENVTQFATKTAPEDDITLTVNIKKAVFDSVRYENKNGELEKQLDELLISLNQIIEQNIHGKLSDIESERKQIENSINLNKLNASNTKSWFKINGILFQLIGNEEYASELEKILYTGFPGDEGEINRWFAPYVYTKNVDHIHVNLFTPSEINYKHSLQGMVKIIQETGYTPSGNMQIRLEPDKKSYIELFIRIPEWAKGAGITVGNVKYLAPPGEYCKIAKQWKPGDIVEIYFPAMNRPDFLK